MNKLRLGFHFHVPAIAKDGQVWLPGFLGRFVDSLARFCEVVVFFAHSPRLEEHNIMDYQIQSSNVILINVGPYDSVIKRTLFAKRYTRLVRDWQAKLDVLLIRGPSPLLPAMADAAGKIPVVLLLVGDYLSGVDELPQSWWRKELIRLWVYWNRWMQYRVAYKSLTFVNSRKLFVELQSKLPNLVETRTTTLEKGDFYTRVDTCQSLPIHLLYTGRLSVSKGLFDVVNAMAILVLNDVEVMLDLVGWPEKGEEEILFQLEALAKKIGLDGQVVYHGYKAVGPELFAYYKRADIYVLASPSSEGFPRTIWEAMAQSLPVVATRVGSIPAFVEGVVELVQPNDPDGLANAILKLLHSPELRQNYIRKGIELARKNTLEVQVGEMLKIIQKWTNNTI